MSSTEEEQIPNFTSDNSLISDLDLPEEEQKVCGVVEQKLAPGEAIEGE